MEGINWPLWVIAFSVLLIAVAMTALLASAVVLLRKIGAAADAVGFAASQTGSAIRKRFSGAVADGEIPPIKKGSVIRGLSVVSAVVGALIKVARRKR
jgi:hypothetical protein